jgi:hypothetical protein
MIPINSAEIVEIALVSSAVAVQGTDLEVYGIYRNVTERKWGRWNGWVILTSGTYIPDSKCRFMTAASSR